MTNQSTIDKLIEMRLTTMADAFRNQLEDPKFNEVPFEDRFGMLVDIEYSNRKNNRQKRLIRNAGFDQPEANIMDINYTSGRKLNKDLINRLATCEYISEHRNLFITGATGCGKTYMACAFGMEACKRYYNTKYVRLPDLLIDLEIARTEGNYRKVMAKYANPLVLILDEWLLLKPTETEQKDILAVVDRSRDFLRIPVISRSRAVFLNTNSSVDLNFHLCVLSADTSDSGLLIGHLNSDKRQKPDAQTEGCPNGSFRGFSNAQAFMLSYLETGHIEHPLPYASGFRYCFLVFSSM